MAHRNVAAAGLIHIRARGRILTTVPASALRPSLSLSLALSTSLPASPSPPSSLSLFLSLFLPRGRRPSYKYNRTQCPPGTYFHFIL